MLTLAIPGYYCPNGTRYDTEFACPPGTYNSLQYGTSMDDCQECPGGEYCEGESKSKGVNYT